MTTIEELRAALDAAQTGTPETSVESAITVYQVAAGMVDAYTEVKDQAKALIGQVMEETGVTSYATRAGKVAMTAPSVVVSYDARALDVLCQADADLALKLFAHRKEAQRAGTMRITGAK
jgi:hypothetical protein